VKVFDLANLVGKRLPVVGCTPPFDYLPTLVIGSIAGDDH
jgi:hypothetical protein